MKCSFCGHEFKKESAEKGCRNCPMTGNCGRIKCPKCNYENYDDIEFGFVKKFKKWRRKNGYHR